MQCDCTLTREEMDSKQQGCLDDCLNMLLFIECGKNCSLGDLCANKRFQRISNSPIEVFKTTWKGFGIRAASPIAADTFIMEYVGEVLDSKQFRKRAKQYSKQDLEHFYFMALSKDLVVDATTKGNISRFINHSCDPNSETQKWTVNGELRVGFFTRRDVAVGEELTFDYKYERYGQHAQKCHCQSYNCRGWLGGEPGNEETVEEIEEWSTSEEEDEEEEVGEEKVEAVKEKKEEKHKKKKKKRKRATKIKNFEAEEFEEEIERLQSSGIKNKLQTVELCRLMVRATRIKTRLNLAELLMAADTPCRRLFIDYQGLRILWSWMMELEWSRQDLDLKISIQCSLSGLSIPHKTMLKDSKVYETMEKWVTAGPQSTESIESVPNSRPSSPPVSRTTSPRSSRPSSPRSSKLMSPSPNMDEVPSWRHSVEEPVGEQDMDLESDEDGETAVANIELPTNDGLVASGQLVTANVGQVRENSRPFSPEPLPPGEEWEPNSPTRQETETYPSTEGVQVKLSDEPICELGEQQESTEVRKEIDDMHTQAVLVCGAREGEVAKIDGIVADRSEEAHRAPEIPVKDEEADEGFSEENLKEDGDKDGLQKDFVVADNKGKGSEELPKLEERGEDVAATLSCQADVAVEKSAEVESEELGGGVEPVGREEIPEVDKEAVEIAEKVVEVQRRAKELLESWALLQEMFKIPKKERQKMRVEHEREADRGEGGDMRRTIQLMSDLAKLQAAAKSYATGDREARDRVEQIVGGRIRKEPERLNQNVLNRGGYGDSRDGRFPEVWDERYSDKGLNRGYQRIGYQGGGGRGVQSTLQPPRGHLQGYSYERSRIGSQGGYAPVSRDRRNLRLDDRTGRLKLPHLNKEDRRMLFAAKVEEEQSQKKMRDALAAMHSQACRLLGLDPAITPLFKKYPEFYFDTATSQWIPMPPPPLKVDPWEPPNMAFLPPEAYRSDDPPLPNPRDIYPPGICPFEPEPPEPVRVPIAQVAVFEDICAYYEEEYLTRPVSPDPEEVIEQVTTSPYKSPSPCPEYRRRDRSKDRVRGPRTPSSSPERRIITRRSTSLSPPPARGPRTPPSPWTGQDRSPSPLPLSIREERIISQIELSPNYRSPSPVHWSPRPVSPSLVASSLPSAGLPVTPDLPFFPTLPETLPSSLAIPQTVIPFLDSDPKHEVAFQTEPESRPDVEISSSAEIAHPGYYTSANPGYYTCTAGTAGTGVAQEGANTTTISDNADQELIVKLPNKWRMARDSEGRAYYYHSQTKAVQWIPPTEEQLAEDEEEEEEEGREDKIDLETASTDSEAEEREDGDDTDTEEDSDEDEVSESTDPGDVEEGEIPDSDLSASEKKMLLRMRRRTKEERLLSRRQKKERDKERREGERQWLRERHNRHRKEGLVTEHIIPARITDKDKVDLMTFKEMRERLLHKDEIRQQQEKEEREEEEAERREKERLSKARRLEEKRTAEKARRELDAKKFQQLVASVPAPQQKQTPEKETQPKTTTTAAADTSSDVEKQYKDKFIKEMSKVIVKILDPYRKKGVKGHISSTEDFKHLAKKLTYTIMMKEIKSCRSIEELKASDKVKNKATEFVRKYMKRYESEYKKSPDNAAN